MTQVTSQTDNVIVTKSFDFAVRIVKLYKYLIDEKKNILYQNNSYVVEHQLVRI